MKLLTLNTYSWVQTADPETYAALIADILENEYDAIALQEVNQLSSGTSVNEPEGYLPTQNEIPIKSDNFAYFLVKSLASTSWPVRRSSTTLSLENLNFMPRTARSM